MDFSIEITVLSVTDGDLRKMVNTDGHVQDILIPASMVRHFEYARWFAPFAGIGHSATQSENCESNSFAKHSSPVA
jgi:hypothetical protein